VTWRKCDFWSSDPNRSLGLNLVHFSNLKEKWTTTLQKFFTLLQPSGGCKIFISIQSNLIKKCISFNGSYAKILCIPFNSKCVLHCEPEYLFPNQIILGSLRKKTNSVTTKRLQKSFCSSICLHFLLIYPRFANRYLVTFHFNFR
jgi:hypothetical protein